MVTYEKDGDRLAFYGLSTDTKPTTVEYIKDKPQNIPNASTFYEMNTKKVFMFNAGASAWIEQ